MIPLNIEGRINQTATKANAQGFVNKDAVGLFAVNYLEGNTVAGTLVPEGNQADNVKYIFDETNFKWNPVRAVYYKDINTHADLYLYYPYQASISDVNAAGFEVKKDQSAAATATELSGYEASDFLWGKGEDITPSQTAVAIKLSHKLAAVQVALAMGTGFEDGEFESLEKSIILTGTTRKATIDYATGNVTAVGNPQLDGIVMCPQGDGSWRAIAIPQTVAASTQLFAITVNGVSYKFSQTSAVTYQSGKQTDFTITVSKKSPSGEYEFALTDVQINDWTEDKNTHGGEARQYFVVNVTEPGTLGKTIKA
ncbi:MAG: fimbrillin family protein, partial [Bacteroidaceae bacterium]|nr:fimbrillin family protein [Bacteroidaceae bacterium]